MHVEHTIVMHYRPRRPALSLSQIEIADADLWKLRDSAPTGADLLPSTSLLHAHHLQSYFNTVFIALYRPYIIHTPEHLTSSQRGHLRSVAQQRVKEAAANTTTLVNKLVALDLISLSANMFVTSIMFAAQIHLFEIKQSEGLARQYASHHFNLHVLVLSQLRRTYWTADHQHKLFTETLKAVENGEMNEPQNQNALRSRTPTNDTGSPTAGIGPSHQDQDYNEVDQALEYGGLNGPSRVLEDFFLSFNPNPFMGLPTDFNPE